MLESMEGRRAMPRLKPPFPSQVGYLGRPTLIQNVETLAHIPAIAAKRRRVVGRARNARGDGDASLVGDRARSAKPGCYEAPNGVTTRELVEEHAGGFTSEVGAVVPGGAASGILPPPRSTRRSRETASANTAPARARPPCRSSPRRTRRSACSPRRCASSPRSRARSARRAGSATARSTTSPRSSSTAARDDAREGRRVAARDGEDVDLRARPGIAVPRAERDDALARAVRTARHVNDDRISAEEMKARMLSGELYRSVGEEIARDQARAEDLLERYNATRHTEPRRCGPACCASCSEMLETT